MNLKVKNVWSPDIPDGRHLPDNPEDCYIVVQADIGPSDSEGADTFTFGVTTPIFIENTGHRLARHEIVLPRFSWDLVRRAIQQRCAGATGSTWEEVAQNIAGQWEFEDYRDSST